MVVTYIRNEIKINIANGSVSFDCEWILDGSFSDDEISMRFSCGN